MALKAYDAWLEPDGYPFVVIIAVNEEEVTFDCDFRQEAYGKYKFGNTKKLPLKEFEKLVEGYTPIVLTRTDIPPWRDAHVQDSE